MTIDAPTVAAMAAALTAFCAFAGLGITLTRHMIKYAYDKGVTDNRLDTLEKAQDGFGGMQGLIAAIQATMTSINQSVARLDRAVEHLTQRVFDGQ